METGNLVHVMCPQRRRQNLEENAGARMKESEHMRHGETAAGLLISGLTKCGLQLRRIRHAEPRAIDVKGAMAAPATMLIDRRAQSVAHALQQELQHLQGQPGASFAIGSFRKDALGEIFESGNGKISMKDLDHEEMNRGDRIEHASLKTITDFLANRIDVDGIENVGNLAPNAPQRSVDV